MTDPLQAENEAAPPPVRPHWGLAVLTSLLPGLVLSIAFTALAGVAAGGGLGFFLGGLAGVTLLSPVLAVAERRWTGRALAFGGVVVGTAAAWLLGREDGVSFLDWMQFSLVLGAYAATLAGTGLLLSRMALPAAVASAIAVTLGLLWLSWPVWTAPWMEGRESERLVSALVAPHPLFVINGGPEGPFPTPWAQYRLAYRLTKLGDHLNYSPPGSIFPCVTLHGIIAAGCVGAIVLLDRRNPPTERTNLPEG